MLLIMIAGGVGTVLRYILAGYASILLVNVIGVFLIGATYEMKSKYKIVFHSGFLGGFTSLSAIYLISDFNLATLIVHVIIYLIVYQFARFLGGFYG
jgi:fluoride ion exporter CrcB/FEX